MGFSLEEHRHAIRVGWAKQQRAGDPFDVCRCGDYRHQHVDGHGRCRLDELCFPSRCQRFRLGEVAPSAALKAQSPETAGE
jgi:hypothetical protein